MQSMNQKLSLLLAALLLAALSGCGDETFPGKQETDDALTLTIVDGAKTGELLLAGDSADEVYTLETAGGKLLLDGKEAKPSALQDGMSVEVIYQGDEQDAFPRRLEDPGEIRAYSPGTKGYPAESYQDLCGLYLQVLEDLWEKDSGLNSGVKYLSVDLSKAPGGLTEGQQHAIAWRFAANHEAEPLMLTYQELAEQGYLTELSGGKEETAGESPQPIYEWEDGLLCSITPIQEEQPLPDTLRFSVTKWRTPLGAYFLDDCQASWDGTGAWSYSISREAIA